MPCSRGLLRFASTSKQGPPKGSGWNPSVLDLANESDARRPWLKKSSTQELGLDPKGAFEPKKVRWAMQQMPRTRAGCPM